MALKEHNDYYNGLLWTASLQQFSFKPADFNYGMQEIL